MPAGLHKMVSRQSHLQMGMRVDISFAQLVDVGGLVMMLSYVRKKGSSANMPLLPKAFPSSPSLGAKSVTQWIRVSLLPGTLG